MRRAVACLLAVLVIVAGVQAPAQAVAPCASSLMATAMNAFWRGYVLAG
jgi:hypothetical protein